MGHEARTANPWDNPRANEQVTFRELAEVLNEASPEPLTATELSEAVGIRASGINRRLHRVVGTLEDDEGRVLRTKKVGSTARVWWMARFPGAPGRSGVEPTPESVFAFMNDMNPEPVATEDLLGHFDAGIHAIETVILDLLAEVRGGRVLRMKRIGGNARIWWTEAAPDFEAGTTTVNAIYREATAILEPDEVVVTADEDITVVVSRSVEPERTTRVARRFDALGLDVTISADGIDPRSPSREVAVNEEVVDWEDVARVYKDAEASSEFHTAPPLERGENVRLRYTSTARGERGVHDATIDRIEEAEGEYAFYVYVTVERTGSPRRLVVRPGEDPEVQARGRNNWRRAMYDDEPSSLTRVDEERREYEIAVSV